jgi:hypothetical protein
LEEGRRDDLARDYNAVLRESTLLTTFCGILFGFLLNIAVNTPAHFSAVNTAALLVAIFSITVAVSLFVMPVVYHHLQYPYTDIEKFKSRSHRFIIFGIAPAFVTLYLGLEIALSSVMVDVLAFALAAVPFALVYVLFKKRK